jgi:F420-dependent oxidoreductase-like protein
MRLALNLGFLGRGRQPADMLALAREAEQLGFSSVWVGEAQSSDAPSMLAWLAPQTRSIGLGAGVMQIPARSAAMTAMTAATLDALSHGRLRLGLGLSGPQVSEGWHGTRFDDPLTRMREYVDVVRLVLRREEARYAGQHLRLPLTAGEGRPLHIGMRPLRDSIPIYIAALGARSLELAGEIGDGWLALFLDPSSSAEQFGRIRAGRQRAARTGCFDVVATVPLMIGDDVEACAEPVKAFAALYVGGMGSRQVNFYNRLAHRMGYAEAARTVQDQFLRNMPRSAVNAVPFDFVDRTSLIGPADRIGKRLRDYASAGVTTLSVMPMASTVAENIEALRAVHGAAGAS